MAILTRAETRRLFDQHGLRPRRRFGQNFLFDAALLAQIADAAELTPADIVLEIGPGHGNLTQMLAARAGRVLAVEIDHGMAEIARLQTREFPNCEILEADILDGKQRLNAGVLARVAEVRGANAGFKIVSNLPYAIITPFLIGALTQGPDWDRMVVMIQADVWERIAAAPGTREYGILTVILGATATVRKLRNVPPTAFWPEPEVDSTVIVLEPRLHEGLSRGELPAFAAMVRFCFGYRRKTLGKIVTQGDFAAETDASIRAAFADAGIESRRRGDTLTLEEYALLHRAFRNRGIIIGQPAG